MGVEGTRALKGGNLRFLYKLREGPANESFGVHVARLAGLPSPVVDRAWKLLEELESHSMLRGPGGTLGSAEGEQLGLFAAEPYSAPDFEREPESGPEPDPEALKRAEASREGEQQALEQIRESNLDELTPLQALNLLAKLKETLGKDKP
jgi:DNA mismatch repair protein MutS